MSVELYDPIPRQWNPLVAELDEWRHGLFDPWRPTIRGIWTAVVSDLFPKSAIILWRPDPYLLNPRACGLKNKDTRVVLYNFSAGINPVLIVQINDEDNFHHQNRREKADREMLALYRQTGLMNDCKIPLLWGVSAFGTRIRFYCADARKGMVLSGTPQPGVWTDENGGWTVDLFSEEGCIKMHEIANYIMREDANSELGRKLWKNTENVPSTKTHEFPCHVM